MAVRQTRMFLLVLVVESLRVMKMYDKMGPDDQLSGEWV